MANYQKWYKVSFINKYGFEETLVDTLDKTDAMRIAREMNYAKPFTDFVVKPNNAWETNTCELFPDRMSRRIWLDFIEDKLFLL